MHASSHTITMDALDNADDPYWTQLNCTPLSKYATENNYFSFVNFIFSLTISRTMWI